MAATKKTEDAVAQNGENAATKKTEDTVSLRIERVPGDSDPNVVVGLNGKNYVIPKGKTVVVPRAVAEEYRRAMAAHGYSQDHIDNMITDMRNREKESEVAAAAESASKM